MKRDMDLVRSLLLAIETDGKPTLSKVPTFEGFDHKTVAEHVRLLIEAGWLTAIDASSFGGTNYFDLGLTWDGHDFLDKVRDSEIWGQTKAGAKKVGSWSIALLGELAVGYAKAKMASLGLPIA